MAEIDLYDRSAHLASQLVSRLVNLQSTSQRQVKIRLPSGVRYWFFERRQQFVRSKGTGHVIYNPENRLIRWPFRQASEYEVRLFIDLEASFLLEWLHWYEQKGRPPLLHDLPDQSELLAQVQAAGELLLSIPGRRPRMSAVGPSGVRYRITGAGGGYQLLADRSSVYSQTGQSGPFLREPSPGTLRFLPR